MSSSSYEEPQQQHGVTQMWHGIYSLRRDPECEYQCRSQLRFPLSDRKRVVFGVALTKIVDEVDKRETKSSPFLCPHHYFPIVHTTRTAPRSDSSLPCPSLLKTAPPYVTLRCPAQP